MDSTAIIVDSAILAGLLTGLVWSLKRYFQGSDASGTGEKPKPPRGLVWPLGLDLWLGKAGTKPSD